jgi:hypothetical protein
MPLCNHIMLFLPSPCTTPPPPSSRLLLALSHPPSLSPSLTQVDLQMIKTNPICRLVK